jgi:hypothetical protein
MATQGDTRQARSVKAIFDDQASFTPLAGAVLFEQAFRKLGLRRAASETLSQRNGNYSSDEIALQVIAGLLCGGRGFQATAILSHDADLARIFGVTNVASGSTIYRSMCDFAGLEQRNVSEHYVPAGRRLPALDMFGEPATVPKLRRLVPSEPEAIGVDCAEALHNFLTRMAKRVGNLLKVGDLNLCGFLPVFGDGTDIEVRGHCFDAARKNYRGNQSLRIMSLMAGPLTLAISVLLGNSDEGAALPREIEKAADTVRELAKKRLVLALLDAAFAEAQVIEKMNQMEWKYIVCANQFRQPLQRLADEQPASQWKSTGPDVLRGWTESWVALMTHQPEGWSRPVTLVVRRWKVDGDHTDHYSFLYTNLEARDLPNRLVKKFGVASAIWQLYGTKQGRENNFKTLLTDIGLHHPPSGRLGATQAFAHMAAVAANIHAFIAYRVVPEEDRGIRLWRFVRDYVTIAGKLVMESGRRLLARLAGGGLPAERKRRFLAAQASLAGT